jgi:PAS domain S-box-containing protein
LFEHIRDAAFAVSPDGTILSLNPAFELMTGFAISDWIGKPFAELLHPGDLASAVQAFEKNVSGTAGPPREFRLRKNDGSYLIAEILLSGRVTHGTAPTHLGIARDVTERKTLEEQVRRMQRLESLGALAAGIAHDLNNALSPIVTGVQLLHDSSTDPAGKGILSIVEQSAYRSRDIVKQVLTFARGKSSETEELQARYVVSEIVSIIEKTFPKNIEIVSSIPKDLDMIRGNATELQQIMKNLCVNARDAMEAGGKLTVAARNVTVTDENRASYGALQPNRYVELSVADTGSGVPASIRDRIFDPFFSTKGPDKGTGLGLATVASIVRDHGGAIFLQTEENRGATFSACFPALTAKKLESAAEESKELPRGAGERLLVVDDEQAILHICRETLEAYGYAIETASNGAEALELFGDRPAGRFRLVLTDLGMPLIDGSSLVATVRKIDPKVATIVMTGSRAIGTGNQTPAEHGARAAEGDPPAQAVSGADAMIAKPFTAETLLVTIHHHLHR